MKKYSLVLTVIFALLIVMASSRSSFAYLSSVPVLQEKDIVKLTDSTLTSAYLDTIIELEAIQLNHMTGGFTPKEYQEYKSLLRYKFELRTELQRRQLDIPSIKDDR